MGVDAQMLVKTRAPLDAKAVRRLSVDLCEAFGHDKFMVWEDWKDYETDAVVGRHALEIVGEYGQDGDSIFPEPGETLIEVHFMGRYYGEGYERGDLGLIINVASWLEARIPGARIFYGGDSSGICAEPFDAEARAALWAHFCRVGHRPYRGGFGTFRQSGAVMQCGFCDEGMIDTGGSRDRTFYYCSGCGKKAIRFTDGRVQIVPKGKEFFDMRDEPSSPVTPPEGR